MLSFSPYVLSLLTHSLSRKCKRCLLLHRIALLPLRFHKKARLSRLGDYQLGQTALLFLGLCRSSFRDRGLPFEYRFLTLLTDELPEYSRAV